MPFQEHVKVRWRVALQLGTIAILLFFGCFVSEAYRIAPTWGQTQRAWELDIANDMREVAVALESYRLDHGMYPPDYRERPGLPTLPHALTTPTAYIERLPQPVGSPIDPHPAPLPFMEPRRRPSLPLLYYADNGRSFLIVHYGWDESPDIQRPEEIVELGFNDALRALMPLGYDPTNGTVSGGDIWRIKR